MIKRLIRWIIEDELDSLAGIANERFCEIESKQYEDKKMVNRHESQMRLLREKMKILQTRQVNILNTIEHLRRTKS